MRLTATLTAPAGGGAVNWQHGYVVHLGLLLMWGPCPGTAAAGSLTAPAVGRRQHGRALRVSCSGLGSMPLALALPGIAAARWACSMACSPSRQSFLIPTLTAPAADRHGRALSSACSTLGPVPLERALPGAAAARWAYLRLSRPRVWAHAPCNCIVQHYCTDTNLTLQLPCKIFQLLWLTVAGYVLDAGFEGRALWGPVFVVCLLRLLAFSLDPQLLHWFGPVQSGLAQALSGASRPSFLVPLSATLFSGAEWLATVAFFGSA